MSFSQCRATYGLQATGTPTSTQVSGTVQIGASQAQIRLTDANVAYSLRAIFASTAAELDLDLTTGSTVGSTAFAAGAAQVETATIVAAGGCTSNGTMTLVVTAAGLTGSPLNVPVALTTTEHTTAALIAAAARTALGANAAVAARFTIGGTGADISLTHKPTSTFTVPGGTLNLYAANDGTLNLAIPSGLGVTVAGTSANTTAGVASSGVKIYDGDGKDFEGETIPTISAISGLLVQNANGGAITITGAADEIAMGAGDVFLMANEAEIGISPALTFTSDTLTTCDLTITVVGASS